MKRAKNLDFITNLRIFKFQPTLSADQSVRFTKRLDRTSHYRLFRKLIVLLAQINVIEIKKEKSQTFTNNNTEHE